MKLKKTLSIALATTFVASLAGCGSKKANLENEFDKNGNYVPQTDLELTVWETQGTDYAPKEQYDTDVVAKWLKDKTKTTVKDMYGNDGGQWDPKLTKLVAGNNLPDIVHCGAGQGAAHFTKLNELGKVYTLTEDEIKKYAPEVWKRTPQKYWDKLTVDGKILGIPYYSSEITKDIFPDVDDDTLQFWEDNTVCYETDVTYLPKQTLWIRDDILQKFYPEAKSYQDCVDLMNEKGEPIGDDLLDIPITTTQEFIDFMYKIKDANIKENGKTVYPFGYNGGDNWVALTWLGADMYGYKNHSYSGTWNDETQQMEVPLVHDVIREAAKEQNKMVNDKVIDPESLAHTSAQYKEKVLNGQYAIVPLSVVDKETTINDELAKAGKTWRFRPFITQVPNQEAYPAFKEEKTWGNSLCILNTLDEAQVHQVLNWINTMYTDEFEQVRYWGPESAGLYTETADGKRTFKDEKFNKYFIDGDTSAIPDEKDRLGLQGTAGLLCVTPALNRSVWDPQTMYRKVNLTPSSDSGFRFKKDSPHVTDVKTFPMCQVWEAPFANIPEVVTFWGARDQWESKFKIAFAAKENDFDTKWDEAIKELNNIVDVNKLEKAMTAVAKPEAEAIAKSEK